MKKDRKPIGIIYSVKNKVTGEYYIGATTDTIESRKKDHEEKSSREDGLMFHESISTYGVEAFNWNQIDTAESIDELAQKEKQYILEYNSKEEGLNSDLGGGFKKTVYQYHLKDGSLVKSYDCLESASNAINATRQQISRACLSVNKIFSDFYWSYEYREPFEPDNDRRVKHVIQLDSSKNLLNEFESISEASEVTGVNKSSIAKVCRGERNQAGGYLWRFN